MAWKSEKCLMVPRIGTNVHSWPTSDLVARDVRDPLSLGSVHVTEQTELRAAGPWSSATLHAVVEEAAPLDRLVVLDYGRENIYVAADASRSAHGLVPLTEPVLGVEEPLLALVGDYHGDSSVQTVANGGTRSEITLHQFRQAVEVTPPFDVLVPAFDLQETQEPPPPTDPGATRQPTGHGTGTPM